MPQVTQAISGDGYAIVPLSNFQGGLNLAAGAEDPDVVDAGQAIDLLNVTFTSLGALRQRSGYAQFTPALLTNQPDSLQEVYTSSGVKRLVVGNGNKLNALNTAGVSVANATPTAHPHYFARYAAPNEEALFISNGTDNVRKYVPGTDTFSAPSYSAPAWSGGVKPKFVVSFAQRLWGLNWAGFPSRVAASDPADPLTWPDDNFEDADPGDGEPIMGAAMWGERLYVFKRSRFFVFPHPSVDSDGNADFSNFYVVNTGVGLAASNGIAAAPEGLYFLDRKGVYVTTGQAPKQVSKNLDPFFTGTPSQYFQSSPVNAGAIEGAAMRWYNNRVYLAISTQSSVNDRMLVFDPRYGWWSLWDIAASSLAVFSPSNADELMFGYAAGSNFVGRYNDQFVFTLDGGDGTSTGSRITARWRSGWFSYYYRYRGRWAPDDAIHRLREAKAVGEGTVRVEVSKDFQNVFRPAVTKTFGLGGGAGLGEVWSSDPADVWSTDPTDIWGGASGALNTTKHALVRGIGSRGSVFSIRLSNDMVGEPFAVHNFACHMADTRDPTYTEVAA